MFTIRGAQPPAPRLSPPRPSSFIPFGYGLLVCLASRSLDHRVWQTTSLAGHPSLPLDALAYPASRARHHLSAYSEFFFVPSRAQCLCQPRTRRSNLCKGGAAGAVPSVRPAGRHVQSTSREYRCLPAR
jgi:hypothetical protein